MRPEGPDSSITPRLIEISDHLLCFYDGRLPNRCRLRAEWNWFDDAALRLGVATYAIYRGDTALIYDTFPSVAHGRWMRQRLTERGVKHFTVALSHWHLDHIAGNVAYGDCAIVGCEVTRTRLLDQAAAIEAGTLWGPPAINPLVPPNLVYRNCMQVFIKDICVELHNINIHSVDTTVLFLPAEAILLAGDALEDTLTYMVEIDQLPRHLWNLRQLRRFQARHIYPNHGDPAVLADGGYGETLIDATEAYIGRMLRGASDERSLERPVEEVLGEELHRGWIKLHPPYRDVHKQNARLVHQYFREQVAARH